MQPSLPEAEAAPFKAEYVIISPEPVLKYHDNDSKTVNIYQMSEVFAEHLVGFTLDCMYGICVRV